MWRSVVCDKGSGPKLSDFLLTRHRGLGQKLLASSNF